MEKVCVAIRVYSRIEDLSYLVSIIKKTWRLFDYDIYIISNGESQGYSVPESVIPDAFKIISIQSNAGHQTGSSQLLLAFHDNACLENYKYCVIIEADTWVYGDDIVDKYINKLKEIGAVYAGAQWYDNYCSLATDFAIIDCQYLIQNRAIFDFTHQAECHMATYILKTGAKYVYISENTYPNLPGYLSFLPYPFASKGRTNCFPLSKTVTHHIENLKGGIEEKKRLFDIVGGNFFNSHKNWKYNLDYIFILIFFYISRILFRKCWYSRNNIMEDV